MKNKYLLSLLAALGFSGCSNNNVWDEPCYYGPGPDWTPDVKLTTGTKWRWGHHQWNPRNSQLQKSKWFINYRYCLHRITRDRQLHGKRHSNQYTKIQRVPSQKQWNIPWVYRCRRWEEWCIPAKNNKNAGARTRQKSHLNKRRKKRRRGN